jgi:hypothetical protein
MSEGNQFVISFVVEARWEDTGLVIYCPSAAAREFVARTLDDEPLIVKTKISKKVESKQR